MNTPTKFAAATALLLLLCTAVLNALPVNKEGPSAAAARTQDAPAPLPAAQMSAGGASKTETAAVAGALLQVQGAGCNSSACTQKCRAQWHRGGSCQRGLCICR